MVELDMSSPTSQPASQPSLLAVYRKLPCSVEA
jgi:hypothetical protein